MAQPTRVPERDHIVVVVGVDLSDVSEHLLATARDFVVPYKSAELHVVHVVPSEPISRRLAELVHTVDLEHLAQTESAQHELKRLCKSIMADSAAQTFIHTPTGEVPEEVNRVAREVRADIVLAEAHPQRTEFAKSMVARIAKSAPCYVLAVQQDQTMP